MQKILPHLKLENSNFKAVLSNERDMFIAKIFFFQNMYSVSIVDKVKKKPVFSITAFFRGGRYI
jgi:hypothetical protein